MEEELRALLLSSSGVSSHVGKRINFQTHPQGQALPALVLNTISDVQEYTLDGATGINESRVQVDCYASNYGAAKQLSRSVLRLLSAYQGGGFQGVFHVSSRDDYAGGSNEPEGASRVSMDYIIHFNSKE
jgi:hypothetical protein